MKMGAAPITEGRRGAIARRRTRFVLGMAQMAAAVVSGVLLFELGVTAVSLMAVVLACTLSTASVLLFGRKRARR